MRRCNMVAEVKKVEVQKLTDLFNQYPIVAVGSIEGFPAEAFQEIRAKLQGKAVMRVSKINLVKIAMKNAKNKQLVELAGDLKGPVALIFTDMDSFKLFNTFKKNRSAAPARGGQKAPEDIIVPAGDTGLPPGPVLSDLKAAGINARIDGGSIKVMKDSVVAREGEIISTEAALAMGKLGLKPMKIGMNILSSFQDGTIYPASVLNIDEEETIANFQLAYTQAFNLSVNSVYPTKTTVETLLQIAFRNATNLGVNAVILDKSVIDKLLGKAQGQAMALKAQVN